jgi:ATP-dependent RNA helicase SUPV3L1/SUV3
MVEVWRPGGRSEERRPRHDRNRRAHHRPQQDAAPAAAAGEATEADKADRPGRGRRNRHNEFRKGRDAPAEAVTAAPDGAPAREGREGGAHPPRERFQGKRGDNDKGRDKDRAKFGGRDKGGRDKGGRDKGGRDKRPDSGPSHRQYATSASPRERDRPIDPNSPFAKLAALKEQLTAERKD